MALIKCPECGEEISNKAKACPYCKTKIKNIGNIIIIALSVCLVVLLIVAGSMIKYQNDRKKEKEAREQYVNEYNLCIDNLNTIWRTAENTLYVSDELVALTQDVWSGAIFKEATVTNVNYIFKDGKFQSMEQALDNLYGDSNVKSKIQTINDRKTMIEELYKKTENAPEEFNDVRKAGLEFINAFNNRMNFSKKASGALISYSKTFSELKTTYDTKLTTFRSLIPEKLEE